MERHIRRMGKICKNWSVVFCITLSLRSDWLNARKLEVILSREVRISYTILPFFSKKVPFLPFFGPSVFQWLLGWRYFTWSDNPGSQLD